MQRSALSGLARAADGTFDGNRAAIGLADVGGRLSAVDAAIFGTMDRAITNITDHRAVIGFTRCGGDGRARSVCASAWSGRGVSCKARSRGRGLRATAGNAGNAGG